MAAHTRNTYRPAARTHDILKRLARGEEFAIADIKEEYGLQYAQARYVLKFLENLYNLDTRREGKAKVWSWPPPLRYL